MSNSNFMKALNEYKNLNTNKYISSGVSYINRIKENAEKHRDELINNPTKSEKIVIESLCRLNIKFEFQKIYFYSKNKYYIVDFYIPSNNIIIEIDGGYHITHLQKVKDKNKDNILKNLGIDAIIRYSNNDIFSVEQTMEKLNNIIVQ